MGYIEKVNCGERRLVGGTWPLVPDTRGKAFRPFDTFRIAAYVYRQLSHIYLARAEK
jgi:hypothetical protein